MNNLDVKIIAAILSSITALILGVINILNKRSSRKKSHKQALEIIDLKDQLEKSRADLDLKIKYKYERKQTEEEGIKEVLINYQQVKDAGKVLILAKDIPDHFMIAVENYRIALRSLVKMYQKTHMVIENTMREKLHSTKNSTHFLLMEIESKVYFMKESRNTFSLDFEKVKSLNDEISLIQDKLIRVYEDSNG